MRRLPPRKTNRALTVVALLLALFMAAMEMTVVATAMPTVVAELGGALHYAWVFSAYMLTSTVTVPIYGKLADLYGRKPVFLVAVALFLVGSMASGQARTMGQLVAFRALQGVGAGGMQPVAITIVGDIFNLQERGRMQGVLGGVWAIAGLTGPLIGGLIVAVLSWRWVFYVNVPFGLLSAALVTGSFFESIERTKRSLDIKGAVLLSAAVVALLLGTDGIASAVLLPAAVVLTIVFIGVERRAPEPMLPLSLFASRVMSSASAVFVASGGAMIGLLTFVPLYAQGVLGSTPTEAGATIAPMAISWPIASAISGRLIPRIGFRGLVRVGMICVALSVVALSVALGRGTTSTGHLRLGAIGFGLGMGLANTALLIAVQTSVGFSQRGVLTASTMFFRNIGATVGVGVMGVVLSRALLASEAARDAGGAELVARILGPDRKTVEPAVLQAIKGDLASGITQVMWIIAGIAVAGALAAILFPAVVPKDAPESAPGSA
jgi:EmrB/QacA subfamily drug resistance transporter